MKRLKRYLKDENVSQTELARRCGVSQPTVWGWLHGENLPTADRLKTISDVTGISVDELLDRPQTENRTELRVS